MIKHPDAGIKTISLENIESGLLQWCNNRLRPTPAISRETNLLDGGYLDSLFVMDMVLHIETHYGVAIGSEHISPRNFSSIQSLATMVSAQSAS